MAEETNAMSKLLHNLKERAKELNCLYEVEKLLKDPEKEPDSVFQAVVEAIPPAFQYPLITSARIKNRDREYRSSGFVETPWVLRSTIVVENRLPGVLEVFYAEAMPAAEIGPFLKEEATLINTIAARVSDFIQQRNLRQVVVSLRNAEEGGSQQEVSGWKFAVDLVRRTDQNLYYRIARKLLNHLGGVGVEEAKEIFRRMGPAYESDGAFSAEGENIPQPLHGQMDRFALSRQIFDVAERNLPEETILACVQKWMLEDRASFFFKTLTNMGTSLGEIVDALRRFVHLDPAGIELSDPTMKGALVGLIRRIITPNLNYILLAKNYVEIRDFFDLAQRLIFPAGSHGRIGGKGAGLFLAMQILKKRSKELPELRGIRVPRTWHITSDYILAFTAYNNLEEVTEQKYKDLDQVRQEYPHIIELFKNSRFPPEFVRDLSSALDDLGEVPLIVRSSSLLEDSRRSAFSGKYKSLFLPNQGSKEARMASLLDAIAEVYSSTFGPDPIGYRAERGLLDFHEEMGIIIQEVVGTRVGKYFLPAYAGVAFSHNQFRWSPRIRRDDGLIRLVPGLGTRAVDRLSSDYPMLLAPGQPGLRVNVSPEEVTRYSPSKIDLINLETNMFETVEVSSFFREFGAEFPAMSELFSVLKDDRLVTPNRLSTDFERETPVVTFDGLINRTPFVAKIRTILRVLEETMGYPVDIEFACDGTALSLLQCRPQSRGADTAPAMIPKDVPPADVLFSAKRYVSDGSVPDVTHVVYVDPQRYSEIEDRATLLEVGHIVSALNDYLPKRQFVLMGPGRWGSRGDIKLGVSVTYSDINNTSMLIEVARKKGNYVPDLSFGTHFFQDLVEASIRYLPLYPDDKDILFNERFLKDSPSILTDILPQYAGLTDVVRVIDVPAVTGGRVLKIAMNADLEEALGFLSESAVSVREGKSPQPAAPAAVLENHWQWRLKMAERLAERIDSERLGVKAVYVLGSTKNATAGPNSDIDLLIHVEEDEGKRKALADWLQGWSLCLDEMNYLRTGYRTGGLIDAHFITDVDVAGKSSFAVKIDAVTDPAKKLPLGGGRPQTR